MKSLTRSELKLISGGDDCGSTCPKFSCQCNGTGTWTSNYCSTEAMITAIEQSCSNGGSCTAA